MTKQYFYEDLCYRDIHRDGKPYYQHESGGPCDPDLLHLFSWNSFPGVGSSILELGCGDGFVTTILVSRGLSVTGVDCSSTAISHAKKNLANAGHAASFYVADACNLACVASGSRNFILDCHCLHCLTDYGDRASFLRECCRALTPEGKLFMATMGEQPMEWVETTERSPWQQDRKFAYHVDEKGCYIETLIPPGGSARVNSRIFIREDILRDELTTAGLGITRFERFTPEADPDDITFLIEIQRKDNTTTI